MTKYSVAFKITVVQEYQMNAVSFKTLSQKYNIDTSMIRQWLYLAEAQGLEALKVKRQHRKYSLDEKMTVVDYYQTHEEGPSKVAARFNLNQSQVATWTRIFNEQGITGLRPKHKGRPSTMPKKNVKRSVEKLDPTEKEKLLQENMKLRAALHEAQLERDFLKKIEGRIEEQTTAAKTIVIDSLRPEYTLIELLRIAQLPRATYYDRRHRNIKPDKYADIKTFICQTFKDSFETYGYRRIHAMAKKAGYKISPNTVLRLMGELNLTSTVYSYHTSGYHSDKGHTGTVNDNLLGQKFTATKPFSVMHTDVTQVKLTNNTWGYISAIMDEASREIITIIITDRADRHQLALTIDDFALKMPIDSRPIMHSDQGWQYQHKDYQNAMKELRVTPSMSRKGNCHDNAPMESFFNLMKRECLYRTIIDNLEDLKQVVTNYIVWYNTKRISINKNGLTPVEYREQAIA